MIFMTLIILMNLNKDYKIQDVRKKIHLSTDNIKLLRNDTSVSNFINYLMTTPKFHSLLNQLNHICVNGFSPFTLFNHLIIFFHQTHKFLSNS